MKKMQLVLLLSFSVPFFCEAETEQKRSSLISNDQPKNNMAPVIIKKDLPNNYVQFSAVLRPLIQIPGMRPPYYTYFWEFGDGTFSDSPNEAKPVHRYKKSGAYQVRLYATNN